MAWGASDGNLSRNLGIVAIGLDLIGLVGFYVLAFVPGSTFGDAWLLGLGMPLGTVLGIATIVIARKDRKPLKVGLVATALGLLSFGAWAWLLLTLAAL